MPEKLGEAVLELRTDSKGYDEGVDSAKTGAESLSGSLIKAQIAYDILKKAAQATFQFLKDSVSAYIEHEQVVAQLGAVLKSTGGAAGLTARDVTGMADSLASLTGIEDDQIIKAQNLLLTFTNIGKDVFPQATQAVLDMSTAMGTNYDSTAQQVGKMLQSADAMNAARRMGIMFTDEQIKMGKALFDSGNKAEYQKLILQELEKKFGGSAKAARDTFGGALKNLDRLFGEIQETIGQYISFAGQPFVDNITGMTEGIDAFLKSSEGIDQINAVVAPLAAIFSVAFEAGKQLFDLFAKAQKEVFDKVSKGFEKIVGKGNESNAVFTILGGVMKTVGIAFSISAKIVGMFIQTIVDVVSTIKESIILLGAFGEAMLDPFNSTKWKKVEEAGKAVASAFGAGVVHSVEGVAGLIKTTVDEFATFAEDSVANGKNLEKSYTNTITAVNGAFTNLKINMSGAKDEIANANENIITSTDEATKSIIEQWHAVAESMVKDAEWSVKKQADSFKTILSATQPVFEAIGAALFEQGDSWKNVGKAGVSAIAAIVKAIGDQLSAMAAAKLVEAIANSLDPFTAWAAPGQFASAGVLGAGAGAAYIAAGALSAWADSFALGGVGEGLAVVGEEGPELINIGSPSRIESNDVSKSLLGETIRRENDIPIMAVINLNERELFRAIVMGHRDGKFVLER